MAHNPAPAMMMIANAVKQPTQAVTTIPTIAPSTRMTASVQPPNQNGLAPPTGTGLMSPLTPTATPAVPAVGAPPAAVKAGTALATAAPNISAPDAKSSTATATQAGSTGYDPSLSQVNQPTDTVQGQIKQIIDANSPLMQQAQTRAQQQMNARGLMNSSMAVQAGQAALYDAATPIATADANAYNTTRLHNQDTTNAASGFGAAAENQADLANAQLGTNVSEANAASKTDVSKFNASNDLQAGMVNQDQANKTSQFNAQNINGINQFNASQSNDLIKLGMDEKTQTGLATIEANYKTLMQTSSGASDLYKEAIAQVATIAQNKDMSGAAKTTAMNNITKQLNESLSTIGTIANLDLGSYLTFKNSDGQAGQAGSGQATQNDHSANGP